MATVPQDNRASLIALHVTVLFLNSLNSESLATTKHSLISLPFSKGSFYLAKISVISYETVLTVLPFLK
jgi:hypothetical protein